MFLNLDTLPAIKVVLTERLCLHLHQWGTAGMERGSATGQGELSGARVGDGRAQAFEQAFQFAQPANYFFSARDLFPGLRIDLLAQFFDLCSKLLTQPGKQTDEESSQGNDGKPISHH